MLCSVKKDITEDMALNIAVPLSGVGGLTPVSPLGIDCWENIKILVSPIGSESSGVSSFDSDDAKLPMIQQLSPPKSPEDLKIIYKGRDILDLFSNTAPNSKLWNLRYTHLPSNNLSMFMANRSQYHRLGENSHIHEYSLVKCKDCDFQYTVNSTSSFFCQTSVTITSTIDRAMTYSSCKKRGPTTDVTPSTATSSSISSSSLQELISVSTSVASAIAAFQNKPVTATTINNQNFNLNFQQQKPSTLQQHQQQIYQSQIQSQCKSQNTNIINDSSFGSTNNFLKKPSQPLVATGLSTPTKMSQLTQIPPSMPLSAATSPTSSGYSSSSSSIASTGAGKYQQQQQQQQQQFLNGLMMNINSINTSNGGNFGKNSFQSITSSTQQQVNNLAAAVAAAGSNNLNAIYSILNSLNNSSNNTPSAAVNIANNATGTANNNINNVLNNITNNNNNNNNNTFNNLLNNGSNNSIQSINHNHGILFGNQQNQPQQNYTRMYKYF